MSFGLSVESRCSLYTPDGLGAVLVETRAEPIPDFETHLLRSGVRCLTLSAAAVMLGLIRTAKGGLGSSATGNHYVTARGEGDLPIFSALIRHKG